MANLQDIRRRIKSVNNTAQITKAMQMVAAAKMKKAQDQAIAGRAYADRLNAVLSNLKSNMEGLAHPYLEVREEGKHLIVAISTDKGLCGAINTRLLKKINADLPAGSDVLTIGKKLREQFSNAGNEIVADYSVIDPVPFDAIKEIADYVVEAFTSGTYNKVSVAFTNFISTLDQQPHISQLLPIDPSKLAEKRDYEGVGKGEVEETQAVEKEYTLSLIHI